MDWKFCYTLPYNITRDTNLQSLQYRIIHRIFPCNYWLSKWKVDIDNKCDYCDKIDYLEHYFYDCTSLSIFWNGLKKWWLNNLECSFNLEAKDVLFGICNAFNDIMIDIIKYCILNAKQYIVNCRKGNKEPDLFDYLFFIKNRLEIEILYYKLNNREKMKC